MKRHEEVDPHGKDPHEHGAKLDANKLKIATHFLAYFPNAIAEVTKVSEYGAEKYTENGWKSVPKGIQRYTDACARHLLDELNGEIFDPETEGRIRHAAQVAWNALARLELMFSGPIAFTTLGSEIVEGINAAMNEVTKP